MAEHAKQVADHVLSRHAGRTVVVVGHSNTVLAIANALGAGPAADIDERDYDHVVVVVKPAAGPRLQCIGVRSRGSGLSPVIPISSP